MSILFVLFLTSLGEKSHPPGGGVWLASEQSKKFISNSGVRISRRNRRLPSHSCAPSRTSSEIDGIQLESSWQWLCFFTPLPQSKKLSLNSHTLESLVGLGGSAGGPGSPISSQGLLTLKSVLSLTSQWNTAPPPTHTHTIGSELSEAQNAVSFCSVVLWFVLSVWPVLESRGVSAGCMSEWMSEAISQTAAHASTPECGFCPGLVRESGS